MTTGTGVGDKRYRGNGACTDDDDGWRGSHDKRFRVAAGSMVNDDGESCDGSGDEDCLFDGFDDDEEEAHQVTTTKVDDDDDKEKKSYRVLTEDAIRARQEAETAKVAEVLSIPAGFAAALLRHYAWRAARVQDEWFSDEQRVRGAVGLPADDGVATVLSRAELTCGICFARCPAGEARSAGCRAHFYCGECWRGYLGAALDGGAMCLSLRCPDPSCSAAVVRELVDAAAGGADRERYARFALRSFVEESGGRVRWCPAPGCALAVEQLTGDAATTTTDVFCACRRGFCWRCGEEAHRPVSCDTVRAWLDKNSSDATTATWVLANAKHCPACRRPIEKNQGCMHMTCPAPCGHEFCWICLGPWRNNHTTCDAYRPPPADDGEEHRRRQARASLDRYLYHYERWAANHASLQSAFDDMAALERSELRRIAGSLDVPDSDLEFLTAAYERVADGRRVIKWAFAYGYYLDPARDAAKRALFEDLQEQANAWLERLHGAAELERRELFCAGADPAVVRELLGYYRRKVVDLTRVAKTFLENLVTGFENDLPEFRSLK